MSQVFQMYQRLFVFKEVPPYLTIFYFLLLFRLTNQMLHIKRVALLSQAILRDCICIEEVGRGDPQASTPMMQEGGKAGWRDFQRLQGHLTILQGGLSLSHPELPGDAIEGQELHIPSSGDQSWMGSCPAGRRGNWLGSCLLLRAIPRKGFSYRQEEQASQAWSRDLTPHYTVHCNCYKLGWALRSWWVSRSVLAWGMLTLLTTELISNLKQKDWIKPFLWDCFVLVVL